jgi:hypothetical protein
LSEYYMSVGPGHVDDDDDDEDDDDINGGPMMTMNDWRILSAIHAGYGLGGPDNGSMLIVDTGTNSTGLSSGDVDRGFTSLHRDTSHWEVGGQGLGAPTISRRFVPTIISEDMDVMPQDFSSPARMNMYLNGAAANDGGGLMNDNGPSPIFRHGGIGGAVNNGGPAMFHYTARGAINDGPPPSFHHANNDGPPILHRGDHRVGLSSSPLHHYHHQHHHVMVDAPAEQQPLKPTSQHHQYLNQGFVMARPPPPPQHAPFSSSQYDARWD